MIDYLGVLQDPGFVAAAGREGVKKSLQHLQLATPKPTRMTPPPLPPCHEDGGKYVLWISRGFQQEPLQRAPWLGRAQGMGAATRDMDNCEERDAGGFGTTRGQHMVGQPGTLEVRRAVLATQDGRIRAPGSGSSTHGTSLPTQPLT